MEHTDFVELPYDERRLIVVTDKIPSVVANGGRPFLSVLQAGLRGGLLGVAVGAAAQVIIEASKEFREAGEKIFPITWETARELRFPPGHPRKNVVYVGHPVDAGSYIPAAEFHRFLFQHKVAEAQRLIRSLGAAEVRVIRVQGWDRSAAANLGLGLPQAVAGADVEVGVETDLKRSATQQILVTMTLTPSGEPHVPNDLIWTPHEPLWEEVAAARTESGLKEFVIDVRSTDDFGVNAELKLLIQKAGLNAGGKFVEHEDTVWRLEGTFS